MIIDLAGLLTYSVLFIAFPSLIDSGVKNKYIKELTATGIAPDLHRLPILIFILMDERTKFGSNVVIEN